jgi:hypothetical protein
MTEVSPRTYVPARSVQGFASQPVGKVGLGAVVLGAFDPDVALGGDGVVLPPPQAHTVTVHISASGHPPTLRFRGCRVMSLVSPLHASDGRSQGVGTLPTANLNLK